MQRFYRKGSLLWLWLLLALLTTHCGSQDETALPAELSPAELTMVSFANSGSWANAEEEVLAQFQEIYPDIEIERQGYGQFPQGYLTSTSPPNLMSSGVNYFLSEAVYKQQVVDLSEVWTQSGLREEFPAGFQNLSEYEGKQYYVPVGYTWFAIYYNRELFARYELEPPRTWDEFIIICDTLLANGETPLAISGDNPWVGMHWFSYLNLRLNGAEFYQDLIRGQISYDDPGVVNVVETWSNLIQRDYFVENPTIMSNLEV